jgi:hypothetical protein
MLASKLWGVPNLVWGGVCLVLAIVWVIVWPSDKVAAGAVLRFFILRWFHALTWLLLALAAFIAAFKLFGGDGTARLVAFLSLPVYLIFLITFVTSR